MDCVSLVLSFWWIVTMRASVMEEIHLIILMVDSFSISVGVPERHFAWQRQRKSFLAENAKTDSSHSISGYSIRKYLSGKNEKSHQSNQCSNTIVTRRKWPISGMQLYSYKPIDSTSWQILSGARERVLWNGQDPRDILILVSRSMISHLSMPSFSHTITMIIWISWHSEPFAISIICRYIRDSGTANTWTIEA